MTLACVQIHCTFNWLKLTEFYFIHFLFTIIFSNIGKVNSLCTSRTFL